MLKGYSFVTVIICVVCLAILKYLYVLDAHRQDNRVVIIESALHKNESDIVYSNGVGNIIQNRKLSQLPAGIQMGKLQIGKILSVLPRNGNLLVWGLGFDSPFWHDSTEGKVIFIEEIGTPWYGRITRKYPFLTAYQVKYSTYLYKSFERYSRNRTFWTELDLRNQLPLDVNDTAWDVIIVDAPMGYRPWSPGRYQSIYTSAMFAKVGTHIFVDDYERKVDYEMSNQILGHPVEITRRPMSKTLLNVNKLAHFIVTEEDKANLLNV
ncbi:Polysaccharide biosynthesis [Mactra antiquata]